MFTSGEQVIKTEISIFKDLETYFRLKADRSGFDFWWLEKRNFSLFLFWQKVCTLQFHSQGRARESKEEISNYNIFYITPKVKIMALVIKRKMCWCFCWRNIRSGLRSRDLSAFMSALVIPGPSYPALPKVCGSAR